MPAVKYWKVELFSDTGFATTGSVLNAIARKPTLQTPMFTGYSFGMPDFNVADDKFIELRVSVDCVEVHRIRRSLIGSARVIPIYITLKIEEQPKGCDEDEQAKSDADKYLLSKSFKDAARPLIKWLAENVHPHHAAIVDQSGAELLENHERVAIKEYLRD